MGAVSGLITSLWIVLWVFQIPIGGESSDKLSHAALHIQYAADFD